MTTISWISTLGGDWSDGANWQGGVVPGPLDDAIMMLGGTETITISSLQNVHSIAFHDPSAVIEINPLGTLEANADIVLECADLNVHGTLVSDNGGIAITVLGTIDLALGSLRAGNGIISFTTGDINVGPVSCFVSGTRIAARKGLVPVEELVVGDEVHAHFSRTGGACVQWIGRRHIDCRRHPNPERIWPVRVSAGAFGNAPCRDLWLSPDHAVSMCNVLIPIRLLINDSTIRQIPVDEVTYHHLELPEHDLVLSEGLLTESYLDSDGHSNFNRGDKPLLLFPDFPMCGKNLSIIWETRSCAPLVQTGPKLDAARRLIASFAPSGAFQSLQRERECI